MSISTAPYPFDKWTKHPDRDPYMELWFEPTASYFGESVWSLLTRGDGEWRLEYWGPKGRGFGTNRPCWRVYSASELESLWAIVTTWMLTGEVDVDSAQRSGL